NYFSFTLSVMFKFVKLKNYKTIIVYSNPPILPYVAAIASKLYGTKVVFVSYDIYPEIAIQTNALNEKSIISKTMKVMNVFLYKNVSRVVALSYDMKNFLLNNRNQLKENQITVIPNWFEDKSMGDIDKSYTNKLFKCVSPKEKLIVSYFGNMGIAQDLNTLVEAIKVFKNNENIAFLFAGHGSKVSELKDIAEKEVLENVFIYDFLHGEDFQDALNISDIFIVSLEDGVTGLAVPSKTYSYMMAGKPIIAIMSKDTDISQDLVNNEAGYGIEVGDTLGLVTAIESLKNDKDKIIQVGKNARKLFEDKYTTEKGTSKYIKMMNYILGDK
ncbi:glycosyltransferase family 4 protein, partial [Carnobacterium sp.]|uniref:glycosyltransferase family 4 protein n=1 Tax=Carnobacterium sp. TaxID=48221 RepID=UPI0028AC0FC3